MKPDHPKIKFGKTGLLLVNLGTPDSTSWLDIRKYLKEFLSDRRVIEVNPILWQIILNLFILTFRPAKTAKAYKKICGPGQIRKYMEIHIFPAFGPYVEGRRSGRRQVPGRRPTG